MSSKFLEPFQRKEAINKQYSLHSQFTSFHIYNISMSCDFNIQVIKKKFNKLLYF